MHSIITIIVISVVTLLTRALPFLIFPENKKAPRIVSYLSSVLPCAVMGMLVIYCLRSVNPLAFPHGLPEFISIILVVTLHLWKRNTLISIGAGTICYMLLVQLIFN